MSQDNLKLFLDFTDRVRKLVTDNPGILELGGHYRNGISFNEYIFGFVKGMLQPEGFEDDLSRVIEVMCGKVKPDHWVRMRNFISFQCNECGQRVILDFNGKEFRCVNPCSYPNGVEPYYVDLEIPSGKFVVANDLRKYFPVDADYDISSNEGCRLTTLKHGEAGVAFAYVGNTSPSVYKVNDEKFYIGTLTEEEKPPVEGSKKVAFIITDLWWYSIVDYDRFVDHAGFKPDEYQVVECKPGIYRFLHVYHSADWEERGQIFTSINRIS